MSKLELSAAFSGNPMTAAIHDGRVQPQGVSWHVTALHPSEMFWRQLRFREFDVSEMSLSSLIIAVAKGNRDWVALPVFTTRKFFHTGIVVRAAAGIRHPADLRGRKVGVPEYQQTAAVWTRAALQHEFGVSPADMEWHMERSPETSHGGATDFAPPPGVVLDYVPPQTSLQDMLAAGTLDAAIVYIGADNLVDRSRNQPGDLPEVRTLFPDPTAEGVRYYRKTGLLPVNHCVVIRASLAEKHPWLALNIYSAFLTAKKEALGLFSELSRPYRMLGLLDSAVMDELSGADPLPYGISGQDRVLTQLTALLVEQGLAPRQIALDEIFAPSTLDL